MIDEYTTYLAYGYTSDELKPKSNKKIWVLCDKCGKGKWKEFSRYSDLCVVCAHKGKPGHWKDKRFSDETCKKMSNYHKNRPAEHNQKISNGLKGNKLSEETRGKLRLAGLGKNNHFFGKHHTKETKEKISNANSGNISPNFGHYSTEETIEKIKNTACNHHIAYDFNRPWAFIVEITRSFHGMIHSPKGLPANSRGYSLID